MPDLILICGLPGSGKSTLARAVEREFRAVRFTPDEWIIRLSGQGYDEDLRDKVEALQWTMAQDLLSRGVSVVLENGFWSEQERERYRRRGVELSATTTLLYLQVPIEELKRRVAARNAHLPPDGFLVRPDDIDAWAPMFSEPSAREGVAWDRSRIFAFAPAAADSRPGAEPDFDLSFG